jgi:hypothetical protein
LPSTQEALVLIPVPLPHTNTYTRGGGGGLEMQFSGRILAYHKRPLVQSQNLGAEEGNGRGRGDNKTHNPPGLTDLF